MSLIVQQCFAMQPLHNNISDNHTNKLVRLLLSVSTNLSLEIFNY